MLPPFYVSLQHTQSQGIEGHEDYSRFAADKGTVVGALIGRDHGRGEPLGTPKLDKPAWAVRGPNAKRQKAMAEANSKSEAERREQCFLASMPSSE
jgi:hypothetical protein